MTDAFKQIDVQEVKAIIAAGQVTVVDIRDKASYEQAHIQGAVHVDDASIEGFLERSDKSKSLICYCYHGFSSQSAAGFFKSQGFKDVYSMRGGFEEWRKVS